VSGLSPIHICLGASTSGLAGDVSPSLFQERVDDGCFYFFPWLRMWWRRKQKQKLDPSRLLMDAAHRLLRPGTTSASPGLACTSSHNDPGTASTLGRVGYSSKASLEMFLPTPGRVRPGRAPACSRKPPARSAAA
uniref:Uncharacterized protein n=1 Tax=Athene cunicularia TaxID=194338 RepID=A0A663NAW3_ATHCN